MAAVNTDSSSALSVDVIGNLSEYLTFNFEPTGKWFEQYTYLRHLGDAEEVIEESSSESEDEAVLEDTPEYLAYLHSLDPKEWKEQDHYKVLGLEKIRYKCTPHQIKKAYKRAVLNHHPDKSKNKADKASKDNNEYFNCITRAFEQLSDPIKKMSYDSCDPEFDEFVPGVTEKNKAKFFEVFGKAFENNARFANKKPVPSFGDINSTFEDINTFYGYWYEFDSWREFSYKDEENKETATDRDERRWIDKENKANRLKLKKAEVIRVRKLVDNAYACDPRIQKLKNEEKAKKDAVKNKKAEEARLKLEAERAVVEAARAAKLKEEEEAKAKAEQEKKNKEKNKKLLTKERKNLRTTVKEFDYFSTDENQKLANMEKIESLIEVLNLLELKSLNESIANGENKQEVAKTLLFENLKEKALVKDDNSDDFKTVEKKKETTPVSAEQILPVQEQENVAPTSTTGKNMEWCDEEVRLLVKATQVVKLGTADRWTVVAAFIEEHSRGKFKRTGKEVLAKNKEMARMDPSVKEIANKNAFEKTLQGIKHNEKTATESKESQRFATPGEQLASELGSNPGVWSPEEQKILEQALKTYPASVENRWDRIAECLPSRTKKDCMVRYKELVAVIQSKKKAMEKAATKKK